jgi:hypothetical protein
MKHNSTMMRFTDEVCEKIGNYVYRLVDPRNGETFYVGKGKGNRVFDHASAAIKSDEEDEIDSKLDRIRDIRNEGLEVLHIIHRHEIPDEAVFEVEAAIIDAYPGLTNQQGGYRSNSKGPMDSRQLMDKYALPTIEEQIEDKLLLININACQNRRDKNAIYDQVHFAWRLSPSRAAKADFVLAVYRGVVVGAFTADEWLEATRDNFPDVDRAGNDLNGRFGFRGRVATDEVWNRFVGERGKRLTNEAMKHIQNPIRYWRV